MSLFDNIVSVFFLVFSAYSAYRLFQNRPDLFASHQLSKALTTMGMLALFLAGFVALLFYSLPQGGRSEGLSPSIAGPANKTEPENRYDRSI